ncbi:NAD-glutamate dehydrogenase [Limobrevibacterium gyesilva]|uniref:NAD-glutamate dehydrogenase n=1 Tax=Limobrevibacterium gyesilva TaxID=2991712 RepID=A0AA41YTR7_9PROT|nr:NAD-glutamate dehydrogenase [Limobrevibacterium gyesilva]
MNENASAGGVAAAETAPTGFQELLFGRVDPQDLACCSPADIRRLTESAYRHVSEPRQHGQPDIRLLDHEITGKSKRREITVIEVVNDNMPFLLDSTLAEIAEQGYEPTLVAHPILAVERDRSGALRRLVGEAVGVAPAGVRRESFLHIHLDRIDDSAARARLVEGLSKVYADVAVAVGDWVAMRTRAYQAVQAYRVNPPPLSREEVTEAIAFLEWIGADNFTFLGVREYRLPEDDAADPIEGTGLGLLRDPAVRVLRRGRDLVVVTPEIRAFLQRPRALIITKANVKTRVHRRAHLDYIGVKLFSDAGELQGELRIIGLFTANLYTNVTGAIPYLRQKIAGVVARAGFDPASYAGRGLLAVLESYPRDELFQVDEDTLYRFAIEIMNLSERPRIRALARADEFDRFISVLVFIPKDRYDTTIRRRVGDFLAQVYQGRVSAAYPTYPEGLLARTHFIIGRDEGRTPVLDQETLERGIAAIVRTWSDGLRTSLDARTDGAKARALFARYGDAFSAAYREAFSPDEATRDIGILEGLSEDHPLAVDLYRHDSDPDTRANLRLFSRGTALALSQRVPLLENLGFRVVNERTYRIAPADVPEAGRIWLHDMVLERASGAAIDIQTIHGPVEATLLALFQGRADSDGFNRLVLEAGLAWRDVAMIRALGRYLRQILVPYAQDYLAATLSRHARIAARIVALFRTRFDPAADASVREEREAAIRADIETMLADVASLDDDRILRRFVNLVEAAVRTNFFQTGADGMPRETITFKFVCAKVEALPLPRPLFEIFVYCPRVEGLHLRFGKVARGGLRWSDRPQDYRTEVLGLVKAQQVKNAVIVPVGAKGGFVPQRLPPASDRQAWMAEGTESYRIFVRSLLELTDNLVEHHLVPPADTVRHDADDPYLVVAADKGTATFSDVANALSIEANFWLGDAFASGGSNGYDHKHMGITARGAWEAVKRHFHEMDIDIQSQPITVAGVGDMSGDVFGNGMLLSRTLRLVAAFDHRDVFLDPEPDPEAAWAERKRLFDLPRSSWADYDRTKISTGGGVFTRAAKSIPLSPQVRAAIGLDAAEATPAEVINAILKAPVDLLWFGGIGTYIRASTETDGEVGDRANDAVRIAGADVRAKVIGEGANLGATQRGRTEAARKGVRLNTDAIDNSAGVNTSDVEVNIKVALSIPERDGRLDPQARKDLLVEMTDDVGDLVLRNNYLQTLAISLAERRSTTDLGFHRRFMQALEQEGRLNRAVEFLPDEMTLTERARRGEGLTRPEIAVLLAYAKLALHDHLLASQIPDDPYLGMELERYFPARLRERFPDAIAAHRLRREIIATQVSNAIVNRAGPAAVTRLIDETGSDAPTIAAAYAAARDSLGIAELNAAIDALDGAVPGMLQLGLYARVQELLMNRIVWFIRNVELTSGTLDAVVDRFRGGIAEIGGDLASLLPPAAAQAWHDRAQELAGQGVPADLAARLAGLSELTLAPDIVLVTQKTNHALPEIAATHFAVAELFRLGSIARAADDVTVADYYDRLAVDRAVDAIGGAHRRLTAQIAGSGHTGGDGVAAWSDALGPKVTRIRETVEGIVASGLTVSKLMVAASLLGDLARE